MDPNSNNFCGGRYCGWLEVYLTSKCNGKCSWCIDKQGYHPKTSVSVEKMITAISNTKAENIILLGGEPLLYEKIHDLILGIKDKNIFVTTNGQRLTSEYLKNNLLGIKGINISIHHYKLEKNREITGLLLDEKILLESICEAKINNVLVRLNCNIIKGNIDSEREIMKYIGWAKSLGADKVRFAELKDDVANFVDLAKILNYRYGLNDNPYIFGCNMDCTINNMQVGFRQMCGLQTSCRCPPENPSCIQDKKVLYYDGKIYNGWQKPEKEIAMSESDKEISIKEIEQKIEALKNQLKDLERQKETMGLTAEIGEFNRKLGEISSSTGSHCCY